MGFLVAIAHDCLCALFTAIVLGSSIVCPSTLLRKNLLRQD